MQFFYKRNFFSQYLQAASACIFVLSSFFCTASSDSTSAAADSSLASVSESIITDTSFHNLVADEDHLRAGLLYDATTGKIVWQKDMEYAYPIASLTKMMVALLMVEDMKSCKAEWNDEITVTKQYYSRKKRKKIKFTREETYTLDALFRLAVIASNNEACMIIAKHLDGSVDNFVLRMNERARELQMNKTYFSNPSGLPAGKNNMDNNSSPRDLLLLSLEVLKHQEIINVTKMGYADISNDKSSGVYRNHNGLVIEYENEVDGLKTGFTKNARYCLAATSLKNGHRLISIVLGVRTTYMRNRMVADMMSNYYEQVGAGRLTNNIALPKPQKNNLQGDSIPDDDDVNAAYKTVWTQVKKYHLVKSGETLSGIADRYKCKLSSVKKWNRLPSSKIMKGQKLLVYVHVKKRIAVPDNQVQNNDSGEAGINSTAERKANKDEPVKNYIYHTVQAGDTLWNIAQKYKGVTVNEIKKTNNITSAKSLKTGTRIKIILNG